MSLMYAPQSGISTYDAVALSARPPDFREVCSLPDGLGLLVQPQMPQVNRVEVPSMAADVAIWLLDPVDLEEVPSPEVRLNRLRRQSLLLLPSGIATRWTAAAGMPETIHLHIPPLFRDRWNDETGTCGRSLQVRANLPHPALGACLSRARQVLGSDGPFRRLRAQAVALEAAHLCLLAGLDTRVARPPSRAMTSARLRRVRAYVEENLDHEVCLEDMAGCVGLSPSHFSRAFKAETGQSPYAFVVQARVARVKQQLLSGRGTLADIAMDCGFASQSHMTETFRRTTGLPPARWLREQGRKSGDDET